MLAYRCTAYLMKTILLTLLIAICCITTTTAQVDDTTLRYYTEEGYEATFESADYYEKTWK